MTELMYLSYIDDEENPLPYGFLCEWHKSKDIVLVNTAKYILSAKEYWKNTSYIVIREMEVIGMNGKFYDLKSMEKMEIIPFEEFKNSEYWIGALL